MRQAFSFIFFLFIGFSLPVSADNYFVGSRQFLEQIEKYKRSCEKGSLCKKPFRQMSLYEKDEQNVAISSYEIKKFQKIARKQAYIWVDTILEDQYHADGNTEIKQVIAIVNSGEIIGYKIIYFEKAWYIGNCRYNGKDESVLAHCIPGIITESSFISPDLKTYIRDNDELAEFIITK